VTTEFNTPLGTRCITAGRYFALTKFTPQFSDSDRENDEFIFVIDCSGSMGGRRIAQARECLGLFIRSLPANSFFNLVRFGSRFDTVFPEAVTYTEATSKQALAIAENMDADSNRMRVLSRVLRMRREVVRILFRTVRTLLRK
jgi:hypothetical protein